MTKHIIPLLLASIGIVLADLPVLAGAALPADRTWKKSHVTVGDPIGVIAEYTIIATSDRHSPYSSRVLYAGKDGPKLVIRRETTFDGSPSAITSMSVKIESVGTNETLTIRVQGDQGTVSLGKSSASFVDDDGQPVPSEVKVAAARVLANGSADFQAALRALTEVGLESAREFRGTAFILRRLFFANLASGAFQDRTSPPTLVVDPFDASLHVPDAFDSAFGQAYSQ
ncbi:MAG TPA: hypothetical protein VJS92_18245 [Candidatus Polarisedimenticolaceae bacterium]|nr:hypothetical protein [Candidatus Polarisedimenticolaceae bacterium]